MAGEEQMIDSFSKHDSNLLCGTYADELVAQLAQKLHKAAVWVGLLEDSSGLYRPDHMLVPHSPLDLWGEIEELRVILNELTSKLLDDAYYSENIQQLSGNHLCDLATMLIGDNPQIAITSASSDLINSRPNLAVEHHKAASGLTTLLAINSSPCFGAVDGRRQGQSRANALRTLAKNFSRNGTT